MEWHAVLSRARMALWSGMHWCLLPVNEQVSDPLLQLCCLDASIAVKPIFDKFHTVCGRLPGWPLVSAPRPARPALWPAGLCAALHCVRLSAAVRGRATGRRYMQVSPVLLCIACAALAGPPTAWLAALLVTSQDCHVRHAQPDRLLHEDFEVHAKGKATRLASPRLASPRLALPPCVARKCARLQRHRCRPGRGGPIAPGREPTNPTSVAPCRAGPCCAGQVVNSFAMSLQRECIYPMVVTRGSDQLPMSSRCSQPAHPH